MRDTEDSACPMRVRAENEEAERAQLEERSGLAEFSELHRRSECVFNQSVFRLRAGFLLKQEDGHHKQDKRKSQGS